MNYIPLQELKELIPDNDYNSGACEMLEFISQKQGWEDTETLMFKEFYNNKK